MAAAGRRAKGEGGDLAVNKKARFLYHLLERFECGMQLTGTEVKSIREGGISFADSYVHVERGQVLIEGFHIRPYTHAGPLANHEPTRLRKLLLSRREIAELETKTQQLGMTLVPTRIYAKGRWIKLEIAVAKGKKLHDKRETEKARVAAREMDRAIKERR